MQHQRQSLRAAADQVISIRRIRPDRVYDLDAAIGASEQIPSEAGIKRRAAARPPLFLANCICRVASHARALPSHTSAWSLI